MALDSCRKSFMGILLGVKEVFLEVESYDSGMFFC